MTALFFRKKGPSLLRFHDKDMEAGYQDHTKQIDSKLFLVLFLF